MVCWNGDRTIISSPKQKIQKRNSFMNNIYEQYFNDADIRDYYKHLHNIDLTHESIQDNISGRSRQNRLPVPTGA